MKKTKMTQDFYNRLISKILLQAAKDYINPVPVIRDTLKRLDKKDEKYMDQVAHFYNVHRQKILNDLRSEHMMTLSDNKSADIADKLENADLMVLKRKMKEEERRIEFEIQLERKKYTYKVESPV